MMERLVVPHRPGDDHEDASHDRDRRAADHPKGHPRATRDERPDEQGNEQQAFAARQRREAEQHPEQRPCGQRRPLVNPVRHEHARDHDEREERLGHERPVRYDEPRVHGGDGRRHDADLIAGDLPPEQARAHDDRGAGEADRDVRDETAVTEQPREHAEIGREERRELRRHRRMDDVPGVHVAVARGERDAAGSVEERVVAERVVSRDGEHPGDPHGEREGGHDGQRNEKPPAWTLASCRGGFAHTRTMTTASRVALGPDAHMRCQSRNRSRRSVRCRRVDGSASSWPAPRYVTYSNTLSWRRSSSTSSHDWAKGTTSSSSPWTTSNGTSIASTRWIGEPAWYASRYADG